MPVKRRQSKHRPHLTPELRPKAERLLKLHEQHMSAIVDGTEEFYESGGLDEIHRLAPEINSALGIRPWEDDRAIIKAALMEADE